MSEGQLSEIEAEEVLNSLRNGIPPQRFVSTYSTGDEVFLGRVQKRLLDRVSRGGRMRFISGSWGSGKTHLLRLLAERAFRANFLVSTVQLSKEEAPFNKFEQVFFRVIRDITSPEMYRDGDLRRSVPFGEVLGRALKSRANAEEPLAQVYGRERVRLLNEDVLDIDMRRVIDRYWETYTTQTDDPIALQETRGLLMQWFTGEGQISAFRKPFGVQKMVDRANSQDLMRSLGKLAQHLGYSGLVVLLDEAEMSYSTMRRTNLKDAQNNLLSLINTVEEADGLVLVYAATPDFYDNPKYGIVSYGALSGRIGMPEATPPRALDRVWNIDASTSSAEDYRETARRLRELYVINDDEADQLLRRGSDLDRWVDDVVESHPTYSQISLWRVLITSLIKDFDDRVEGGSGLVPAEAVKSVLDSLGD